MLHNKEKGMKDRNINYRCHDDDQSLLSSDLVLPVIHEANQGDWFKPKGISVSQLFASKFMPVMLMT